MALFMLFLLILLRYNLVNTIYLFLLTSYGKHIVPVRNSENIKVRDFGTAFCPCIPPEFGGPVMENLILYRKRLIPEECIELKDDVLLYRDNELIITKWNTLHPKKTLHHGYSCYFLERGFKISKFYDHDGNLISWYCDIVTHSFEKGSLIAGTDQCTPDKYLFTDLLVDVIVYPNGSYRVVDLDELAEAFKRGLLSAELMTAALRTTDKLLNIIYRNDFDRLQKKINEAESRDLFSSVQG